MGTLSTYRQCVTIWLLDGVAYIEDHWYAAREELGRRVAKSKRSEIAELRHQLADMRGELNKVRARGMVNYARIEFLEQLNEDALEKHRRIMHDVSQEIREEINER